MSNKEEIVLAVTHSNLSRVKGRSVVEGGVNATKIKFQFRTDDWDGLSKRAVFTYRETVNGVSQRTTYVSLNEDGYCDIPPNLITNEGFLSIGVFGVDGEFSEDNFDDYVRIVTGYLHYEIIEGCYVDSDTPLGVSLNAYEEVLRLLDNKSDSDHDHDDKYYKRDEVIASAPEIYIGSGDMPEGYVLQIDPESEVDLPSEGGITLANKAEAGQIIKVAEVNENGVPTEWEAVDFPEGGGDSEWELIVNHTVEEVCSCASFTTDINGNSFDLQKFFLFIIHRAAKKDDGTYDTSRIQASFMSRDTMRELVGGIGEVSAFLHTHATIINNVSPPSTDEGQIAIVAMGEVVEDKLVVNNTLVSNSVNQYWYELKNNHLFSFEPCRYINVSSEIQKKANTVENLHVGGIYESLGVGTRIILYGVRK